MSDPGSIYRPPNSNLHNSPDSFELASRGTRLVAVILDGLILSPITISFYYLFGIWDQLLTNPESFTVIDLLLLSFFNQIIYFLVNGYGLKHQGQSIGKRIMGIRIVSLNGQIPGFINLIVYRYLSISVLSVIPSFGNFLAILNALFIFRADKRCIHDHFCATRVIVAKS